MPKVRISHQSANIFVIQERNVRKFFKRSVFATYKLHKFRASGKTYKMYGAKWLKVHDSAQKNRSRSYNYNILNFWHLRYPIVYVFWFLGSLLGLKTGIILGHFSITRRWTHLSLHSSPVLDYSTLASWVTLKIKAY